MNDLLYEVQDKIALMTINRVHKRNAFDNSLLTQMQHYVNEANANKQVRAIVLNANGEHFCAGADLAWMRSMAQFTEQENLDDALVLGNLMYSLYCSTKPIIAAVQGSAFGGGAGLAAACSIAIAAHSARFCFSEVTLGLIPAVISPYVVKAIGERQAQLLFMSAEIFDAPRAQALHLVQHCVPDDNLFEFSLNYAARISTHPPLAVQQSLALVHAVAQRPINQQLVFDTAQLIARKRVSVEGQQGLAAFLKKKNN